MVSSAHATQLKRCALSDHMSTQQRPACGLGGWLAGRQRMRGVESLKKNPTLPGASPTQPPLTTHHHQVCVRELAGAAPLSSQCLAVLGENECAAAQGSRCCASALAPHSCASLHTMLANSLRIRCKPPAQGFLRVPDSSPRRGQPGPLCCRSFWMLEARGLGVVLGGAFPCPTVVARIVRCRELGQIGQAGVVEGRADKVRLHGQAAHAVTRQRMLLLRGDGAVSVMLIV